jgi:hypothetical protein
MLLAVDKLPNIPQNLATYAVIDPKYLEKPRILSSMLVWVLGAGSWAWGALICWHSACCARRILMGKGHTYELTLYLSQIMDKGRMLIFNFSFFSL